MKRLKFVIVLLLAVLFISAIISACDKDVKLQGSFSDIQAEEVKFGEVDLAETVTQQLTITNDGSTFLYLLKMVIIDSQGNEIEGCGANAEGSNNDAGGNNTSSSALTADGEECIFWVGSVPETIESKSSKEVTISFRPNALTSFISTLQIFAYEENEPLEVKLTGSGVLPFDIKVGDVYKYYAVIGYLPCDQCNDTQGAIDWTIEITDVSPRSAEGGGRFLSAITTTMIKQDQIVDADIVAPLYFSNFYPLDPNDLLNEIELDYTASDVFFVPDDVKDGGSLSNPNNKHLKLPFFDLSDWEAMRERFLGLVEPLRQLTETNRFLVTANQDLNKGIFELSVTGNDSDLTGDVTGFCHELKYSFYKAGFLLQYNENISRSKCEDVTAEANNQFSGFIKFQTRTRVKENGKTETCHYGGVMNDLKLKCSEQ